MVVFPQPPAHFAGRGLRQQTAAGFVGERRLDVSHRQPPGVHLHGQALKLFGPPADHLPNLRAKGLGRVRKLRHAKLDFALGRLHPAQPVAVAIAPAAGTVLA
jgi:hypothetical protein